MHCFANIILPRVNVSAVAAIVTVKYIKSELLFSFEYKFSFGTVLNATEKWFKADLITCGQVHSLYSRQSKQASIHLCNANNSNLSLH